MPTHPEELRPQRRSAAIAGRFVVGLAFLVPSFASASDPTPPIYRFDPRAVSLIREFFPREIRVDGYTNAYLERAKQPRFADLDAVFEHHSRSIDVGKEPQGKDAIWLIHDDVMDSAWLGSTRGKDWQRPLIARSDQIAALAHGLSKPARGFSSVLEKALFQRDLLQMCMILKDAVDAEKSQPAAKSAEAALRLLCELWRRHWLTDEEVRSLRAMRPRNLPSGSSASFAQFDLSKDYVPGPVYGELGDWHPMPFGERESLHFRTFAGRSFVSIYLRAPGWSRKRFNRYWDGVADKFGAKVTRDGRVPVLPAGTETLLVRTFAVFAADGSCLDSGFPEEVLVRVFKHSDTQFDLETSDYRGTSNFQYLTRRRRLLAEPASLGLQRVLDDAPQFFGFFSEAPDLRRSYSANVTTMRTNCVSCHSEAFYGASTVFSLGQKRRGREGFSKVEGGFLEPTGVADRFRLKTDEFAAMRNWLNNALTD
ncbi:MAG: hypothetical protein K2X38_19820 [Gemmataceae bacterium]|nr:hypothetical protein [Gemmataceae bacterium]